jgi:hypothetical protein
MFVGDYRMNYKLYIGLDVENGKPWNRQDAVNIIISVCKSRGINALSLTESVGVYTYDKGETVQESTLVLLLVGFKGDISSLTKDLKKALKQECIMIERLTNTFEFI